MSEYGNRAETVEVTTDVLVVGHGLAGLATAHSVRDNHPDLKITCVDKASFGYGGKANKGGGHVAFIPEGGEEAFVEYHSRNQGDYLNDQDALRDYANSTVKAMDAWQKWGAKFYGRDIAFNAHPSIPWKICLVDGDVIERMAKTAVKRKIQHIDKVDITDLLTDGERVVGAIGFSVLDGATHVFRAKAVVMANGNQNYGIMKMWSSGSGEGIAAVYRAGGKLRNGEFGSFVNIVSKQHGHVSYEAEKFMYNAVGEKVDPDINGLVDGNSNVCGGVDLGAGMIFSMYSQVVAGKGPVFESHDENVTADEPIGQIIFPMKGQAPAPWYRPKTHKFAHHLYERAKGVGYSHFDTGDRREIEPGVIAEFSAMYGDRDMASNLEGLYGAGDINANGRSWCGAVPSPPSRTRGSGLMNAVFAGWTAGRSAGAYAAGHGLGEVSQQQVDELTTAMYAPLERYDGVVADEIIMRVRRVMARVPYSNHKEEGRMQEALREIRKLKELSADLVTDSFHGLAKCYTARAMVLCAEVFFVTSLARKESRGWQIREDYPQRDDVNWLKWIEVTRGADDALELGYVDIPMAGYKYTPTA